MRVASTVSTVIRAASGVITVTTAVWGQCSSVGSVYRLVGDLSDSSECVLDASTLDASALDASTLDRSGSNIGPAAAWTARELHCILRGDVVLFLVTDSTATAIVACVLVCERTAADTTLAIPHSGSGLVICLDATHGASENTEGLAPGGELPPGIGPCPKSPPSVSYRPLSAHN